MTLRTVVRLTPNLTRNAFSDGSGSPSVERGDQIQGVVEGAFEYGVGFHLEPGF